MTRPWQGAELARAISGKLPQAVVEAQDNAVQVKPAAMLDVARLLRESPGLEFDYLASVTGVDYIDFFEVVYHLVSTRQNHSCIIKTRVLGRDEPVVPSVVSVWQGADLQEREVYDLVGIRFEGHPNLKRVLLWEGFPGHPLRRDFILDREKVEYPYLRG